MKFKIKLPENLNIQTVETLLTQTWLVPKKQRHFLRTKKHLLINDMVARFTDTVQAGDTVTLIFDTEDFSVKSLTPGNAKLGKSFILYEDDHLIIVNKPENMKTHANVTGEIALQNHISTACGQPVYVVHRLDFETSGTVLFAKNPFVLPILDQMLQARQIHRTYEALCTGLVTPDDFIIQEAIGTDRHDKKRRIVVTRGGQSAITHVKVLNRYTDASLVTCILDTGRTHQIRVHLSSRGHAIAGDQLYSGPKASRLMLHAKHLELTHPFTQEKIRISATSDTFNQGLMASKKR